MSQFTPDLSKLNWTAISGHITGIVAEVAKVTPSPLDDIGVTYLSQLLTDWLKAKVAAGPDVTMAAALAADSLETDTAYFADAFAAKGKLLSPELIALILKLGKALLPLLL